VTVTTEAGSLTLPAVIADVPDGVVWLPTNGRGANVRERLHAVSGSLVNVVAGGTTSIEGVR
jgi:NADH-quinone oxidoreductase subunit G